MFRRFVSALPPAALLLLCFARWLPPAPSALRYGEAVPFALESGGEQRRASRGEGTALPQSPGEEEGLPELLSRLAACETGTLGSTRRLAALLPPLRAWAAAHPQPGAWEGELRAFTAALTPEERQDLREKLSLLLAVEELPAASLAELLEEAGCSLAEARERTSAAPLLERIRAALP